MKHVFFGFLILFTQFVFGQDGNLKKDSVQNRNYLNIGLQLGAGNFRDFATSPLVYSGIPVGLNLAFRLDKATHETEFGLNYTFGFYSNITGSSSASSIGNSVALYYQRLMVLDQVSNDKWTFKAGGLLNASSTIRINSSLQNNAVGYEFVNTLFASGKVACDVSRKVSKSKKFLFIPYQLSPRKRALDFQLNLGVINTNYRNGYAYIDQSSIVNDPKAFGGYQYHWFEGFRASSTLGYTMYLENNNAIQLAYVWDAYHTGGDVNRFEWASHLIRVSILFNTK